MCQESPINQKNQCVSEGFFRHRSAQVSQETMNYHKGSKKLDCKNKLFQAQMESKGNKMWGETSAYIQLCQVPHSPLVPSTQITSSFGLAFRSPAGENKQNNPKQTFNTFLSGLSENTTCETCSPKQNAFCHSCPAFKRASKCLKTIACPDIRIFCLFVCV